MSWDHLHRCPQADAIARDGVAGILYDKQWSGWFLVHADGDEFDAWFEDHTAPHPLRFVDTDAYPESILIEYCPWCAIPLAEDSIFLAWKRDMGSQHKELS